MSQIRESSKEPRRQSDVAGLLRSFFRKEMPEPWPQWKPPTKPARIRQPRSWGGLMRSRFALAASVLVLLIGSWSISGLRSESVPLLGGTGKQTADKPKTLNKMHSLPAESAKGPQTKGSGLSSGRR